MQLPWFNPFLRYISAFPYSSFRGEVISADCHLNYIQSGSIILRTGGTSYTFPRDTIFYCPKNTVYEYLPEAGPCPLISINFDLTQWDNADFTPRRPPSYDPARYYPPDPDLAKLEGIDSFLAAPRIFYHANAYAPYFTRILEEFRLDRRYSQDLCSCMLKELVLLLHSAPQPRSPTKHSAVEQLLQYIEQNLTAPLDNATLAALVGYHPNHVTRLFQEYLHMSPQQYLLTLRIARAKTLISETDLPFSEVARRSGFVDYPYFSSYFKKKTGLSPAQFRRQSQTIL